MNDQMNANRFIPFRKSDIVAMCIDDAGFPDEDHTDFREFCRILESLIHYEFHSRLETLKDSYAPVNPDADTMAVRTYSAEEKQTLQKQFVETMTHVLNAANFEKITGQDLEDALKEESLFKIRLRVDFNDFEEVIFYRRGESTRRETISKFFGMKTEKEVHIEQRHLIALAMGLATLGGFLFKQINKFKNRKIRFMKALSDNLYFKNLDNNAGVFHHLLDSAEEEEFKEAVLAYYFLLTAENGLTKTALDAAVENWFEKNHHCRIDFEIGDALNKLERWGLVSRTGDVFRSKHLPEAKAQLDQLWDNFFSFHSQGVTP